MTSTSTKIGHGLAKGLGINLNYRNETGDPALTDKLSRGESVFSIDSTDSYVEEEPKVSEYLLDLIPTGDDAVYYLKSLFPFTQWILHYNLQWLIGDLVAGMWLFCSLDPRTDASDRNYHRSHCRAAGHGLRDTC